MFDLDAYINENFGEVKPSGDERVVTCLYCGKRGKMYINVRKRKFNCFRCGAGKGATLVDLLRDHLNVSEGEALKILRSNDYSGRRVHSYADYFDKQIRRPRAGVLPDDYQALYPLGDIQDSVFALRAVTYLRTRGLTDADLLFYRLGISLEGRYQNRIIVPVLLNSEVVYFVARLFFGWGKRYLNPSNEEVPEHPSNLLFNWDNAKTAKVLKLGEGVFDAMGLGDDASCFFTKRIHDGQLRLLETGAFERIEVWLDPDAQREADEVQLALQVFRKPVDICRLHDGDPGELRVRDLEMTRDENPGLADYFRNRFRRRHANARPLD
jgi:hypothetical protein